MMTGSITVYEKHNRIRPGDNLVVPVCVVSKLQGFVNVCGRRCYYLNHRESSLTDWLSWIVCKIFERSFPLKYSWALYMENASIA